MKAAATQLFSVNINPKPVPFFFYVMKTLITEMDIEEWELLPDEGFLEVYDDGGKKIYSRKYPNDSNSTNSVFNMNYFICPSKSSPQEQQNSRGANNQFLLHVLEPTIPKPPPDQEELLKKEAAEIPVAIIKKIMPPPSPASLENIKSLGPDRDPVSQVFFKKMKETEFVDIKVDLPKSSSTSKGIIPQIEGAGVFQFEEKGEGVVSCVSKAKAVDSEMMVKEHNSMNLDLDLKESEEGGLSIWKWSLTGIGAICSFGVAAATVCCFVISSSHRMNYKNPQHNQKLQIQFYTSDKRIKQVVHHASRLNETISAMRGVPINRAHITFGGYYDAAL